MDLHQLALMSVTFALRIGRRRIQSTYVAFENLYLKPSDVASKAQTIRGNLRRNRKLELEAKISSRALAASSHSCSSHHCSRPIGSSQSHRPPWPSEGEQIEFLQVEARGRERENERKREREIDSKNNGENFGFS